jgi:hypothetical protein
MKKQSILLVALFVSCGVILNVRGEAPGSDMDGAPVPATTPAASATPAAAAIPADGAATVETIVLVRHGEKPADDEGQLTFQGLNRALALPDVLIKKYGNANFVFAPGTQVPITKNGVAYSYIRPLITIEPTAIRLHLPVNATYAFDDVDGLEKELLSPAYKGSLIFVAWEHGKLDAMVKQMMTALGGDAATVPDWAGKDYDSIFVVKIRTAGGKRSITFRHDQEGLDGESAEEPEARGK